MSGAWIESPWVLRLALTLLHFVWQGGVIYAGWLVCRALLRTNSAEARYLLALLTLACMGITPLVTFFWLETPVFFHRPLAPSGPEFAVATVDFWAVVYHYYWAIVLFWLTGVGLLALRLVLGYGTTRRLRRSWEPIGDDLAARFLRLADKLRLGRLPQIGFSSKVNQAMTIGFFRPVILLPLAWLTEMTPQVLEAVVAHELAHTRRGDLWVNLLQRLAETLLFFHPAVWWISREIRLEREFCCDELAVSALGQPLEYAKSLEAIATWQLGHGSNLLATPFLGERKMNLLDRVRRVLGTDSPVEARKAWPLGLAILATPLLLWAFSLGMLPGQRTDVVAENPKPQRTNQPHVHYGVGVNSDAGVTGAIIYDSEPPLAHPRFAPYQGNIPAVQMIQGAEIRPAQVGYPNPNQNQRSPESDPSDLSPRDRAMLQMMTELRFEVMALRNEIRQMRQPGGGNHPPQGDRWNPPMPYPNQQPVPHFRSGPGPQNAPSFAPPVAAAPSASLPPSNRMVPTYSDPQEGDRVQNRGRWEETEPAQAEPKVSNAPSRDNPWVEAAEGMMQLITPGSPQPQARDLTPRQRHPNELKADSMRIEAEQAHRVAEEERLRSEEKRLIAEELRQNSELQAKELQQRLKETQASETQARLIAEEAMHRAKAEREHAQEKLHQTQDQLNKAVLRIKELEDKAAEKAAKPDPEP